MSDFDDRAKKAYADAMRQIKNALASRRLIRDGGDLGDDLRGEVQRVVHGDPAERLAKFLEGVRLGYEQARRERER